MLLWTQPRRCSCAKWNWVRRGREKKQKRSVWIMLWCMLSWWLIEWSWIMGFVPTYREVGERPVRWPRQSGESPSSYDVGSFSIWLQGHIPRHSGLIQVYKTLLHRHPDFIQCIYSLLGYCLWVTLWPNEAPVMALNTDQQLVADLVEMQRYWRQNHWVRCLLTVVERLSKYWAVTSSDQQWVAEAQRYSVKS